MKSAMGRLVLISILTVLSISANAERLANPIEAFGESLSRTFGGARSLEYSERGGRRHKSNLVNVNGCSQSARFKTFYGTPTSKRKKRGPKCDKVLAMNRHYVEFANKNLEICAQVSADRAYGVGKIDANDGNNAIYHHGCLGDSRHQHTGSWHNEGMAWDVTAIQLGGTVLKYADARSDRKVASFYDHFRRCWGERVATYGKSCRKEGKKGRPAGTIGNEDRRHKQHLHLSLPCKALSSGRATFVAFQDLELVREIFPFAFDEDDVS